MMDEGRNKAFSMDELIVERGESSVNETSGINSKNRIMTAISSVSTGQNASGLDSEER